MDPHENLERNWTWNMLSAGLPLPGCHQGQRRNQQRTIRRCRFLVTGRNFRSTAIQRQLHLERHREQSGDQAQRLRTMNFKFSMLLPCPNPGRVRARNRPGREKVSSTSNGLAMALGQFDEARVWFRRALQLDHSNDVAAPGSSTPTFQRRIMPPLSVLLRRRRDEGPTQTRFSALPQAWKKGAAPHSASRSSKMPAIRLRRARSI